VLTKEIFFQPHLHHHVINFLLACAFFPSNFFLLIPLCVCHLAVVMCELHSHSSMHMPFHVVTINHPLPWIHHCLCEFSCFLTIWPISTSIFTSNTTQESLKITCTVQCSTPISLSQSYTSCSTFLIFFFLLLFTCEPNTLFLFHQLFITVSGQWLSFPYSISIFTHCCHPIPLLGYST